MCSIKKTSRRNFGPICPSKQMSYWTDLSVKHMYGLHVGISAKMYILESLRDSFYIANLNIGKFHSQIARRNLKNSR